MATSVSVFQEPAATDVNRSQSGRNRRFPLLLLACFLLTAGGTRGADPVIITSRSKQITVRGLRLDHVKDTLGQPDLVLLDPSLLAVTAESIRQSLHQELGWKDEWFGHIFIDLHPVREDRENILVTSIRSPEGWNYRLDMPDEVDTPRLVRTLAEILVVEFANRRAKERAVELPPWLVPGLAEHLQAGPLASAVLAPNRSVNRTRVKSDPLADVRQRLQSTPALTVDQLNWPAADQFEDGKAEHYQACAHLFVHELLRLRDGPACLRETLALLPEHLNWQTAFFRGFKPHFQRMLDVEKWWSLVQVNISGRDTTQIWPLAESLQRLDEVLYTPVQVRLEKDEIPHDSQVSLQTVLTEWDLPRQAAPLWQKAARLAELRTRLDPQVAKLAGDYRATLEKYLRARQQEQTGPEVYPQGLSNARGIITDTLHALQPLDRQREKLWKINATPRPPGKAASKKGN